MVTMIASRRLRLVTAAVVLVAASAATGCQTTDGVAVRQASAVATPPPAHGRHIEAATWSDGPWPFTVAQGDLGCAYESRVQIQTFSVNGVTYALNPAAKDTQRYVPVDAIWRQDPNAPGFKLNIAEVIDYARTLCTG